MGHSPSCDGTPCFVAHLLIPPKRVRRRRKLHIRTLGTIVKNRPSQPSPLMLRFLTGLDHALSSRSSHP
ncbi:hypothetical protein IJ11_0003880 [Lacticaseibacillus paracasei]|nr:hypothetical protein IJ11_0003880 [Lacticaseibacillus paracasei]